MINDSLIFPAATNEQIPSIFYPPNAMEGVIILFSVVVARLYCTYSYVLVENRAPVDLCLSL